VQLSPFSCYLIPLRSIDGRMRSKNVNWTELAHDMAQGTDFVNTVINIRVGRHVETIRSPHGPIWAL
jgi:hypothetical protein